MGKSFAYCIKESHAATIPRVVGSKVSVPLNSGWPTCRPLIGEVVRVIQEELGLLVIVLNEEYGDTKSALPGWRLVPFFLSQQSGILIPYGRNNATFVMQDYRALLAQVESELTAFEHDFLPVEECTTATHIVTIYATHSYSGKEGWQDRCSNT